jgi:phosphate transport system protein
VASDLRFITTALKLVTDLERIGDLASNICERVMELAGAEPPMGVGEVQEMAEIARGMLRDALDAFVARDASRAHAVRGRDSRVDDLYAAMFPQVVSCMAEKPERADSLMRVLSIAKYIERVADHSTNLAEMVIFMVEGEDIRHHGAKNLAYA